MKTRDKADFYIRRIQCWPLPWRVGITIVFVLIATAARLELFSNLGSHNIFLTFYPAIILGTLLGGIYCGFLATILLTILLHLLIDPVSSLVDSLALVLFIGSGVLFSLVIDLATKLQQKKISEFQARKPEELLTIFINKAPIPIALFDRNMRYLAASKRWTENFLSSTQNIIGRSHYEVFPQCPDRWRLAHQKGLAGETIVEDEDHFIGTSGRVHWIHWEVCPWHTCEGNVGGITIFTEDVTEKVEIKRNLISKNQELQLAHKVAQIGTILININKDEITASEEGCDIFGFPQGQAIKGNLLLQRVHREDKKTFKYLWAEIKKGKELDIEFRIRKFEQIHWLRILVKPETKDLNDQEILFAIVQDISSYKKADFQKLSAEKRFQSFFQTAGIAAAIINKNGLFIDVNEQFCKMTGYSRDEIIEKKSPLDLDHPDEREEDKKRIASFMSGKDPIYEVEKRYVRKNGEVIWVRVYVTPIKDDKGQIFQTAALIKNITKTKKAEQELIQSEARFRSFFHNLAAGCGLLNNKGEILDVNESFCRMVGYTREEIIGKMLPKDFDHPESSKIIKEPIQELLRKEIPSYTIDKHCLRKDGQDLWLRVSSSPILNEFGEVTQIAGVLQDITSTKATQLKLVDSEERLRLSMEAAEMGVWDWDLLTNNIIWNDQMYRFLGLPPQSCEADLNIWMEHIHPEDKAKFSNILDHISGQEPYFSDEYRLINKSGNTHWVYVRGHTTKNNSGKPVRSYGVVIDITKQKRIQLASEQSQKLESVGQLAGGIIHDLNNLLIVISGNLELAQKRIKDKTTQNLLNNAINAVETGAYFNKRLLSLSQKTKDKVDHIYITERIRETTNLIKRLVGENIEISLNLAPHVWPILFNFNELDVLLLNLIINARDAMPSGGKIEISTQNISLDHSMRASPSGTHHADYVKLSIIDSGEGMSEDTILQALDPFFTTKAGGKGTGLGLYIVNASVKKQGGFINIESKVGQGTKMEIYLPRSTGEIISKNTIPLSSDVQMGDGQLILVVEDEPNVREMTMKRLESLGYAVEEASSAEEGIQKLKSNDQISLVLSDIILTGKQNGYDLTRWIISEKPAIKVVLNSGYNEPLASPDHMEEIAKIPMLKKPYSREELACAISEAFGRPKGSIRETSLTNT